jgi:hypothetical protein
MIKLLDVENNRVIPTVHCKTIKWLKVIEDNYPKNFIKIYGYIFYMSCPSQENPYFNVPVDNREDLVITDLDIDFSLEDDEILEAVKKATVMYQTPTVRAYQGITTMLDNLTDYMSTTQVTAGRDGNINSLLRIAKEFDAIRQSYKGIAKDLEAEQQAHVRGGQELGYDQM